MDKKYFLMLKEHKVTGKKYLCYHLGTTESCYKYTGSGTYWKSHLKKHGNYLNTTILFETFNKELLKVEGLKYSKLWKIVESVKFANLVDEDGSGGHQALQRVEVRTRAANTFRERLALKQYTDKELNRGEARRKRIKDKGFTSTELKSHIDCSNRQKGKSMKERLANPNYTDSRKGKTMYEICGEDYNGPWNKGKSIAELKGHEYTDPRCKPFKIISSLGIHTYQNEREFLHSMHFSAPLLSNLKKVGHYIVKRQSNTSHPYKHGETIYYEAA